MEPNAIPQGYRLTYSPLRVVLWIGDAQCLRYLSQHLVDNVVTRADVEFVQIKGEQPATIIMITKEE